MYLTTNRLTSPAYYAALRAAARAAKAPAYRLLLAGVAADGIAVALRLTPKRSFTNAKRLAAAALRVYR